MTAISGGKSKLLSVFIIAVAAFATASVVVHTWQGAGVNADATSYVSVAENFADGNGLRKFNDVWHTAHPPGFPVVMAGLELLGLSARSATRWLNAALYGATILFAGMWLKSVCRHGMVVVAAVIAMAVGAAWHKVSSVYFPGALYLLLTFGSLVLISRLLRDPPPQRSRVTRGDLQLTLAAGALAGASAVTRYIGVVVIASSFAVLLIAARDKRTLKARVALAGLYGLVASLPVAVVLGLNTAYGTHLVGNRANKSSGSLEDSIERIVSFQQRPEFLIAWVMLLMVPALALLVRRGDWLSWLRLDRSLPFLAFGAAYVIALVSTQHLVNQRIDGRYLLPAWLAFVVVSSELLDKALSRPPAGELAAKLRLGVQGLGAVAIALIVLAGLANQEVRSVAAFLGRAPLTDEDHAAKAEIHDSDLFDYLDDHPIDGVLHSNRPNALYWIADRRPVKGITESEGAACADWMNATKPQHVLWFTDLDPYERTTRCDLPAVESELLHHRAVYRSEDGVIYRADISP